MELRDLPPEVLLAAAGVALSFGLVQTLRLAWQRARQRRRLDRSRQQGAAGEARAEALLCELGYTILGRQVAVSYGVQIDGEPVTVGLRADYVVSQGDRRYVAEVKTGRLAPRIDTPATRRQLLEYRLAFDVDGVLLVDADTRRVRSVVFPLPAGHAAREAPLARLAWFVAAVVLGVMAAMAAQR
ncbi:hypothetical protein SOCEGT47_063510 [Sorangium cellulosum]|uniref:PD-(D/E)XK endonuclease-like domain-containing protein n=1 Tax=Sorangium cellulosum TaxID=56 RepID=A0A4P2Q8H8_SORCE|nr:PD-(D/E)XK nuclease family protein [Sorangium cellulosum]AUX25799.1 hypothetical protein SOCEGT47_063510 [Sorangium cellulosum]